MLSALSKRLGAVSLSGVVPRAAASATAATLRPQAPAVGACVVAALQGRGASFWGLGGSSSSSSSTASAGVPLAAAKGAGVRGIATTPVCRAGMNDFYISRPQIDKDGNPIFPAVGRSWKVEELRQKSFEDLHKLWWICLKERNSLAGERHEARSKGMVLINPRRWRKVRKTMTAIKTVLGERQRMRYYILREERDTKRIAQKEIDDAAEKETRAATRAAVLKKAA